MSKTTIQLHFVFQKYRDHFAGALHTILWEIYINEKRDINAKKSAFTAVISNGCYQLAIVDEGEKGYQPTPAVFKTNDFNLASQIANLLNEDVFGLTPRQAGKLQVQSFG